MSGRRALVVTDYTIHGLTKDDVELGVRAINHDGDLSPVAYAVRS
jgi:hypothetical protein